MGGGGAVETGGLAGGRFSRAFLNSSSFRCCSVRSAGGGAEPLPLGGATARSCSAFPACAAARCCCICSNFNFWSSAEATEGDVTAGGAMGTAVLSAEGGIAGDGFGINDRRGVAGAEMAGTEGLGLPAL